MAHWDHLTEWHVIGDVRQGHNKISGTFMHGEHEGQNRADLIEDLLSGKVRLFSATGVKIEKHQIC